MLNTCSEYVKHLTMAVLKCNTHVENTFKNSKLILKHKIRFNNYGLDQEKKNSYTTNVYRKSMYVKIRTFVYTKFRESSS